MSRRTALSGKRPNYRDRLRLATSSGFDYVGILNNVGADKDWEDRDCKHGCAEAGYLSSEGVQYLHRHRSSSLINRYFKTMRYTSLALAASSAAYSSAKVIEVSDTLPVSPVPYVVRHLDGPKVLLADDVFRFLSNENTTGTGQANETADGFSMLLCNGKPNDAVPPHYVSNELHVHRPNN